MAKKKSLSVSAQTKHDITRIVLLTLAVYGVMLVVVYSGGSNECSVGQTTAENCEIGFPFIATLLFPAAACGGAILTLLKQSKAKGRRRK